MYSYQDPLFWIMVIGGLGLFLFGIASISDVLKRITGGALKKVINKCSSNRFLGFLAGAGFTAVIQSSSGTSALAIGLVRAGVMSMVQAIAIIIGANVGTTITAFIVSLPIGKYLSVAIFIGSMILLLSTRRKWRNFGDLCFAVGSIFFGLWIMEMNLASLANIPGFTDIFIFLAKYPWLGLLAGTLITVCLQSSSAVIGVLQGIYAAALLSSTEGAITEVTLFGLLPIIFGANIGTTSTAILSCIGGSKASKRVAFFHCFYNISGALIFMGIIYCCKDFLNSSNTWYHLDETGNVIWNVDPKVQLALCHLIFNGATALLFLPLIGPICKLSTYIIRGEDKHSVSLTIKELDSKMLIDFPTQGIALAKEQVITMFTYSKMMFETIGEYIKNENHEDADFVHEIEASIDRIDRQMNDYLLSADKGRLSNEDMKNFSRVLRGCKDIERIGDYGENLIVFYETAVERKEKFSDELREVVVSSNNFAIDLINKTIEVFKSEDKELAKSVIQARRDKNAELDKSIENLLNGITKGAKGAKYLDLVLMDIINAYQRVFSHCSNIAKLFGNDKHYVYTIEEEEKFAQMAKRY